VKLAQELRMLRILQKRVNKSTKVINKLAKGSKKRSNLAEKTYKKQAKVTGLTRKLAYKLQKEEAHEKEHEEGKR